MRPAPNWNGYFLGLLLAAGGCSALLAAEPQVPPYTPTRQVTGLIRTCGSPQMGDLLKLYEAGFRKLQPSVRFDDDLKSTLTAVAGVSSGHADIALLGREIWPKEVEAFSAIKGYAPTVIEVATGSFDVPKATFALMIFVPRSNPIASLSTAQLARIFGSRDTAHTWGELGLKGEWAKMPIHRYGFAVDNDKAHIFSQLIFAKGETWAAGLHEFSNRPAPNGADAGELILRAAAADPGAIAISNVHYAIPAVRALPISAAEGRPPIVPTKQNVATRAYPLARAIYIVVDKRSKGDSSPAVAEFLRYVLSRQGQQAVIQEGNYLPLTAAISTRQIGMLASP